MDHRKLVEDVGAIYVGTAYSLDGRRSVRFRAGPDALRISVFASALRSPVDVELALKNFHERQRAEAWQSGV
jgi:hypothetical protein